MAPKRRVLLQLDTDSHASSFDALVAIDSGVDVLLPYSNVSPENVRELVYGAMFTRGAEDLRFTAISIGGRDVGAGEDLLAAVRSTLFPPMNVSILLDSNGANTTAAASVLAVTKHVGEAEGRLEGKLAVVLGATGPVGGRVARLLAKLGATVRATSRTLARAEQAVAGIAASVAGARIEARQAASEAETLAVLEDAEILIAAGGPGARLLSGDARRSIGSLALAIDLNAVPPEGLEGVKPGDRARERDGQLVYGAFGVGALKMKIHRACIARLFESNDVVIDADEALAIARTLEGV